MNIHENDFDRKMREKFGNFRPDVSSDLWDKISLELDAREKSVVPMPTPRKHYAAWWMSAAAVVIMGVFGLWLYRPADVIYLQGASLADQWDDQEMVESALATTEELAPAEEVREPISLAPIRALFVGRSQRKSVHTDIHGGERDRVQGAEKQLAEVDTPVLKQEDLVVPASLQLTEVAEQPVMEVAKPESTEEVVLHEVYGYVVEPHDALEEAASKPFTHVEGKPFGVSDILNIVMGSVDSREEKLITFSNDDEGSIRIGLNRDLARLRKRN